MENARRTEYEGVPVIGISRHRLGVDGNGVTTLVAFHGCTLRCKYCLNPEALGSDEGLTRYTPESLYEKVKVDSLYFMATGGGITFGGGEPCMQSDFIARFRELCGSDWKLRLETSLNVPLCNIEKLVPVVDEWIVDIKTDCCEVYERYTGGSFNRVNHNLLWLVEKLKGDLDKLVVRIPVIPGFTDPRMVEETRRRLESEGVSRFDLFTYRAERPRKNESMIEGLPPGKAKCKLLKALRKDLSERYGIRYRERQCDNEGDCTGTCPLCEAELESLTREIEGIAPRKLEVSDEIIELCQLNKSFSSDRMPETEARKAEIFGLETQYGPHYDDPDHDNPDDAQAATRPKYSGISIAEPTEPPILKYKRVFFKECAVAGLSFHLEKDDELWDELCEGAEVALVRDRKNKYDRNAVAVALADDYGGDPDDFDFDFILGYIPRTENAEIAAMMDAGYADKFKAEITTYHRHGNYNDRIRITIWLLSSEPEQVRPDRLRVQSLGFNECKEIIEELQRRGTVHFRWGFFNDGPLNLPTVGEEVVLVCRQSEKVLMFRMKVIAKGEDCAPYLDEPEEIHYDDDRSIFVLTNIAGPVTVDLNELYFLDTDSLGKREVYDLLTESEDRKLRELFDSSFTNWLISDDFDPQRDKPKEINTLSDLIDRIFKSCYTFYYRDTASPISFADYQPGTIIRAGFTVDASEKFYKPAVNTRFLIAGFHTVKANPDYPEEWRLIAFDSDTHFIVADIYNPEGSDYRQILLVQLPEEYIKFDRDELLDAIRDMDGPYPQRIHGDLIDSARYDFDAKLKSIVFPRQKDRGLIKLMKRPVGRRQ